VRVVHEPTRGRRENTSPSTLFSPAKLRGHPHSAFKAWRFSLILLLVELAHHCPLSFSLPFPDRDPIQ
jgi:hypothetical protein